MARRSDTSPADGTASTPSRTGPKPLTEAQVGREVSAIARSVEWSLGVPGRHYSGLSYDALLDVLEDPSDLGLTIIHNVATHLLDLGVVERDLHDHLS